MTTEKPAKILDVLSVHPDLNTDILILALDYLEEVMCSEHVFYTYEFILLYADYLLKLKVASEDYSEGYQVHFNHQYWNEWDDKKPEIVAHLLAIFYDPNSKDFLEEFNYDELVSLMTTTSEESLEKAKKLANAFRTQKLRKPVGRFLSIPVFETGLISLGLSDAIMNSATGVVEYQIGEFKHDAGYLNSVWKKIDDECVANGYLNDSLIILKSIKCST